MGTLSTAVGRWSIPLAFLIPGLAVLGENLFFRGVGGIVGSLLFPGGVPSGGYILDYLGYRADFGLDEHKMMAMIARDGQFDAATTFSALMAGIDWAQMAGGIAVAVVLVWLASEYRRRVIVA